MQRLVKEYRADIGIALDGDADRLVICDEKGQVVDGDQIMALIAAHWAKRERLSGGGVVATVMSNLGLERFLHTKGLKLERTQVGDRYVMERMRAGSFNLGGEQSGHIILRDFATTGGEADQHRIFQVERLNHCCKVVCIRVHVVSRPRLTGSPVTTTVVGNGAEAV